MLPCCDCQLRSYRRHRRLADIRLKKNHRLFLSNIGSQCRFVIKLGHIFVVTAMISECPFKVRYDNALKGKYKDSPLRQLHQITDTTDT